MIQIIKEFFLIGVGTFGGGLAMIPLFLDVAIRNSWLTEAAFTDLVSISQATPGPIAINMATFVGYRAYGFWGGIVASFIIVLPGYLITITLARFIKKHKDSIKLKSMLAVLRCAILGLLLHALIFIGQRAFFVPEVMSDGNMKISIPAILMFCFAVLIIRYTKLNLAIQIFIFAFIGIFAL